MENTIQVQDHIDFINRCCSSDILESALFKYIIDGEKNDPLVNAILVRNKILEKGGELKKTFKFELHKYKSILVVYLQYRNIFYNEYKRLFLDLDSKTSVYNFWNYEGTQSRIRYMSTLTKFDSIYIVDLLSSYIKGTVVDVGGNDGTLASEIKKNNSGIDITVWDLPQVVQYGSSIRKDINFVSGDFFKDRYPKVAQTAIIKSVLVDHPDKKVITLLSKLNKMVDRIIICEVMGGVEDIPWEEPYFTYLIPFYSLIRKPSWYKKVLSTIGMKIVYEISLEKSKYHIIVADRI